MPKIIYYSYSPSYAAAVAAAIHLGILPGEYIPDQEALFSVPYFGQRYASHFGTLIYVGIDERLNEIYILGVKGQISIIENALSSANNALHIDDSICYADMGRFDNLLRGQWLPYFPMKLYYLHLKKQYIKILKAVAGVKKQMLAGGPL